MAWWRKVVDLFRASTAPGARFDSPPRPIDQVIMSMLGAGVTPRVSRAEALSVPAVQRGRNLMCSISTLPLVQYNARQEIIRNPLLEQFDRDVPNVVHLAQTVEDLLFEGIAWWEITATGAGDFPTFVRRLDPGTVSLDPPAGRSPAPLPGGQDPRGQTHVWVDGRPVPASKVIRFDSPNPAVLKVGGRAIKRALLLDQAAAMYADDPRPLDYFTPADGADEISDDDAQEIIAVWRAARKRRSTGWIPRAMNYNTVATPSPAELQLVELQRQAGLEIANALGVDPEELGISTTSRTYFNATDRRQARINDVLAPYMRAITDRLSMGDVTRRGHVVRFNLDDYMRVDPITRVQYYQGLSALHAITEDEIREAENMPPLPADAAPEPAPVPVPPTDPPADEEVSTVDAFREIVATFDGDRPLQFADVPVQHFAVDRGRRIIEGLALPYNATAGKGGLKFRFLRGALKWSSVNRVKLLRDHDMTGPIGVAQNLTDMSTGLKVRFKVARGPAGDEALQLAEDGVLDGMSVGVDFDLQTDVEVDANDDSVMLVRRADLREVSLTAMPAFDDARVTKVAASRATEGSTMEDCATCGQRHAPGVACPPQNQPAVPAPAPAGLNLSSEQVTALLTRPGAIEALVAAQQAAAAPVAATPPGGLTLSADQVDALVQSGQLGVLLGVPQLTPRPTAQPEQRETVDPTRRATVTASVSEPAPYRFDRDGNLTMGATYDFSTDLIAGARGDSEAMDRAQKFLLAQAEAFTRAQYAVDTTGVAGLNPNINRPDMYVDQRDFQYPMWDAISKGTLANQTPFVLPKFATATGLVAAHVQGTEPTPGAFTATSQTITPSAVSGKVEITREAWDQGGNPQLSGIIWRQMTKAWFEALEASAVALLDAATPTGITLPTAAQDDALVSALEEALASLQYIRGGFRMRDLFFQIDLYKALVNAVDADGRKLLPLLGPVNAAGQVSEMYADLNVGGLRGRPGWALAASGTVAASSYLFDRGDVHGWATAPQRLQFEYRVAFVDVAIWGYKATAITDITGVREIIYDPA